MFEMSLDDLNRIEKGVKKCWIYKDDLSRELAYDFLLKINYSIQDINYLLDNNQQVEKRTDVISIIVMICWIVESVRQYKSCLLPNLLDNFYFSKQEDLSKSYLFIKAIRSFIVAHPLNTDKHEKFGFDGDIICIDLRNKKPVPLRYGNNDTKRISLDGIERCGAEQDSDLYLCTYSRKANAKFFQYYVVDFKEIIQVAKVYIEQLYEIDRYLSKLKKKNYAAK